MDLTDSVQLLERYSAVILPVLVVAEQVGVPLPAVPALLAVGALAAKGRVNLLLVIGAIVAGGRPLGLVWPRPGPPRAGGPRSPLWPPALATPAWGGPGREAFPSPAGPGR